MAANIQTAQISAPGFFGLNTQESPLDLAAGYALTAVNCVIDRYGRIGSRKGWTALNTSTGDLGSNAIGVVHELVQNDGTLTIVFAGNNKLFKLNSSNAFVTLTYGGGATAPTITANNWMCASLNGITYFFQSTYNPLIYDPTVSTTTFRRVSEKTGYAGTVPDANIVISAYGRLWAANTSTEKTTVYFSDLLSGHIWTGGTAGSLNVDRVWPNGADEITGLAAHNGYLFIFGKRQILVYGNATTPASITLSDTVGGIGCIARDTIQVTSSDVVFLSNSGVRSMMRTIQDKSAPERDLSKNIRTDLQTVIDGETLANIKTVYSEKEAFYLLVTPSTSQVYCFDYKAFLENGACRATIWDSITPTSLLSRRNGDLLFGKTGYVAKYSGYQDNSSSYRFQYFTNHADLGNPNQTSILKRLSAVIVGGTNQTVTFKWGFDFKTNYLSENITIPAQGIVEYGTAEYDNPDDQVVTITNASPAVITSVAGSFFLTGSAVTLTTTGTLPTGLATATTYYIINAASPGTTTCNLSATLGGSAINTSSAGSGTHTLVHASPAVTQEYSDGVALQTLVVMASGAGKIVQTGYETNINGSGVSIQKIEIQTKDGNVT